MTPAVMLNMIPNIKYTFAQFSTFSGPFDGWAFFGPIYGWVIWGYSRSNWFLF